MGLLDDFRNEPTRTGTLCRVHQIRELLEAGEVADLDDALRDRTITAAAIERVLGRKGLKITATSITRHRRQECNCGK